ncbi:MAG: hypothetical protein J6U40_14340, partial [Kiritimatiellae bacterium]|nr:hypothetical protein [Kiritimatiellia bacterium]
KLDGFDRFVLSGSATLDGDSLKLTQNAAGETGAAFFPSRVRVNEPWQATFSYQAGEHGDWTTDLLGAALVLHNDPAGPAVLGTGSGANLGCAFAKSVGTIMRVGIESDTRNRYGFSNAGTISDDTSARSNAVAADGGKVITISVSYDGTALHASWDCNGTVRTRDWTVDIASVLGSDTAWIGFTGATGASTGCEQTILTFSFRGSAYTAIPAGISEPGNISSADWSNSRYTATYTTLDGKPAFELTPNVSDKRSSVWNNTRISVTRPFHASFKYRVTDHTTDPADGMVIAIQNYDTISTNCYGATGGSLGIVYGTPRARTVGWGVNLYKSICDQCFKFVLDGSFNGSNVPLNLWDLVDGQDTEFTLSYDLRALTLTATRGNQTVSATREVDLISAMNGTSAWIGFTGATGGSSARQLVYDFEFAYDEVDLSSLYANPFVVEGAAQMNLGLGTVGFADLTLKPGATLTVGAESGTTLDLAGTTLEGGATITSATAPIVLEGTIAFDSDTGILKLVGDVCANGKVKLALTSVKGIRDLIDLTEATTSLTVDDFEVAGDLPSRMHLDMKNGKVRIWREAATMITIR